MQKSRLILDSSGMEGRERKVLVDLEDVEREKRGFRDRLVETNSIVKGI